VALPAFSSRRPFGLGLWALVFMASASSARAGGFRLSSGVRAPREFSVTCLASAPNHKDINNLSAVFSIVLPEKSSGLRKLPAGPGNHQLVPRRATWSELVSQPRPLWPSWQKPPSVARTDAPAALRAPWGGERGDFLRVGIRMFDDRFFPKKPLPAAGGGRRSRFFHFLFSKNRRCGYGPAAVEPQVLRQFPSEAPASFVARGSPRLRPESLPG